MSIPTAAVATMYGYISMLVNLQCNQGMHSTVLLPNEKGICIYAHMAGECFWVQHYCNENWWALVGITGVFFSQWVAKSIIGKKIK